MADGAAAAAAAPAAASTNKRPADAAAGGGDAGEEAPPRKSIKFAADTKPAAASSVGFKLPGAPGAGLPGPGAAAGAASAPAVHANQKIGVPVDLDGGYRCGKTGRWIGNGTWVRAAFVCSAPRATASDRLCSPLRASCPAGPLQKPLWVGNDLGSWEGSHWYGIPDEQQEAYRKQEQEKAAAARAADAAAAGAE